MRSMAPQPLTEPLHDLRVGAQLQPDCLGGLGRFFETGVV